MFGRCPKCGSAELQHGVCAACGFPAGKVTQLMTRVYLVTGAIAASVLVYAAVAVAITGNAEYAGPGTVATVPISLLGVGIVVVAIAMRVAWTVHQQRTPAEMFGRLVIAAALCETPAVLGLILTVATKDLKWIAIFTALSLVSFVALAREMPALAQAIVDYVERNPDADVGLGAGT